MASIFRQILNNIVPYLVSRLGLAYAGSNREDVISLLLPVMGDSKSNMEVSTHLDTGCQ